MLVWRGDMRECRCWSEAGEPCRGRRHKRRGCLWCSAKERAVVEGLEEVAKVEELITTALAAKADLRENGEFVPQRFWLVKIRWFAPLRLLGCGIKCGVPVEAR